MEASVGVAHVSWIGIARCVLVVTLLGAVSACGGSGDTDDTTPTTNSSSTTTTTTTTAATTSTAADEELFLKIDFPRNGQEFSTSSVTFKGLASAGATVTVGSFSTAADEDERWSLKLPLGPDSGPVDVTVRATDDAGGEAEATVRIIFTPAVTSTTQEPSF